MPKPLTGEKKGIVPYHLDSRGWTNFLLGRDHKLVIYRCDKIYRSRNLCSEQLV